MEQARRFQGQERQVFEYLQRNEQAQAQLRAPILEDKVCDFIIEMAQVSERKVPVEELMRDPDEDDHDHHDHDHGHDHHHHHHGEKA
jgi:trigger factor